MAEKVEAIETINVAADKVWDAIRAVGGLDRWFPIIAKCTVEGTGVGATRVCVLGDGATLYEKVLSIDEATRTFRYGITDSPLPVSEYVGTVVVSDAGGGKTTVNWTAEFDVVAEARDEVVGMLGGAFADGIKGMESDLG